MHHAPQYDACLYVTTPIIKIIPMKKILLISGLLLTAVSLIAQDSAPAVSEKDTAWRANGFFNINFSQVSLSNWAAGGENSISGVGLASVSMNYITTKTTWENALNLGYGLTKSGDNPVRKFEDKIDFLSKYARRIKGKWSFAALVNFQSQFSPGYKYYPNDSNVLLSEFFAPAVLLVSVGFEWKPVDYFSVYISPATGKFTFVNNQALADQGAFGVDPLTVDPVTGETTRGKNLRSEFGAYASLRFKKEVMHNVSIESKLDLFDNYTDKVSSNKKNVDVNWATLISMKINKFIVASIGTELIYDHNTPVPLYSKDATGEKVLSGTGPRTQFKEVLAIGFSYKF